jgi:N-dimethylarginine dimethylaminohydrolase
MIAVDVTDDFAPLRTVLVHNGTNVVSLTTADFADHVAEEELREHPETGPVFWQRVVEQQSALLRLLAFHGVTLTHPETRWRAISQVFTRDPCFAIGDTLFIGTLRGAHRQAEFEGLAPITARVPNVVNLGTDGAMIEGGDVVLPAGGRLVLVGLHRHTNEAGMKNLATHLAGHGREVVAVPHTALHLDCCLAPLPNGEALYAADRLPESSRHLLAPHPRLIELDREEAALHLAANLLWLNDRHVVSGLACRKTNELLRSKGYEVHEVDFSQLVCLWGSVRCVTCPLVRG